MLCDTIPHTTNQAPSNSVIQASTMPGLSNVTALRGNILKCSVEDKHKYEPTVHKSHEEIPTAE